MKQIVISLLIGINWVNIHAQPTIVRDVNFPRSMDSLDRITFLTTLEQFVLYSESGKPNNPFILPNERLETEVLTDELIGIRKEDQTNDSLFYSCHLSGLMKSNDSCMQVTLTYMTAKNDTPKLKAVITILALKSDRNWYFHSMLKDATRQWKQKSFGHHKVFYRDQLNVPNAKNYFMYLDRYDAILKVYGASTLFYSCNDFQEAMRLCGIVYHKTYQGSKQNSLQHGLNKFQISVNGIYQHFNETFDPHDLWHAHLRKAVSKPENINRPVDEGAAYLFGGSWGISWDSIQIKFNKWLANNPNTDWMKAYNESINFNAESKYPLNVDFILNAFIIQDIIKKKGFDAAKPLLLCGKKQKDNANYYAALQEATGVAKSDYNNYINSFINQRK